MFLAENDAHTAENTSEKQNVTTGPKTFVGTEILEGKMVCLIETWISCNSFSLF